MICKKIMLYFLLILCGRFYNVCAVSVGFDTYVSIVPETTLTDTTNQILTFAFCKQGFALGATGDGRDISCDYYSVFPVGGPLLLNGGTLNLYTDVHLSDDANDLTTGAFINNNTNKNYYIELPYNSDATVRVQYVSDLKFQNVDLVVHKGLQLLSGKLHFQGTSVIRGDGSDVSSITLGSFGNIIVDADSTLVIENVALKGMGTRSDGLGYLRCASDSSNIILRNVKLYLDSDYDFSTGNIRFEGACEVIATGSLDGGVIASNIGVELLSFRYASEQDMQLAENSTLRFLSGTLFVWASPNNLVCTDKSSIVSFQGGAVGVTNYNLTTQNGTWKFDNAKAYGASLLATRGRDDVFQTPPTTTTFILSNTQVFVESSFDVSCVSFLFDASSVLRGHDRETSLINFVSPENLSGIYTTDNWTIETPNLLIENIIISGVGYGAFTPGNLMGLIGEGVISLNNVTLVQSSNLTFGTGTLNIMGDCVIKNAYAYSPQQPFTFAYTSSNPLSIAKNTSLTIEKDMTFVYNGLSDTPGVNNLILFADQTSKIILDNGTFNGGTYSTRLTKGTLEVRGISYLKSDISQTTVNVDPSINLTTSYYNPDAMGVAFGNNTESDDFSLIVGPDAQLIIGDGAITPVAFENISLRPQLSASSVIRIRTNSFLYPKYSWEVTEGKVVFEPYSTVIRPSFGNSAISGNVVYENMVLYVGV